MGGNLIVNFFDNNGMLAPVIPGEQQNIIQYTKCYDFDGVTIFTDDYINNLDVVRSVKSKYKIFWLVEPKVIYPNVYNQINQHKHLFDYIFTHDQTLINDGAVLLPFGGCWIPNSEKRIHTKFKNVSIVASTKRHTQGHKLRHQICSRFDIDKFGSAYRPVKTKDKALSEYKFSIVVENCSVENYFTEKLIDCFATGTIPIYWGCKNIGDFFNLDGMFVFNNLDKLLDILVTCNEGTYHSKMEYIIENFELAKQYYYPEHWIKKFIEEKCM